MLRPDLRGRTPYGAPQLDVPVALNTNENSYAVPPVVVAAMTDAVADVAAGLNRYPDREFTALREALAAYLSRSGTEVTAPEVWAGNGSNEVLLHLLQAFGGSGRTALGFTPAYSMHPVITTTTGTTWVDGMRGVPGGGAFDLDPASAVEQVSRHRPDVVFLCSPNNPTGTALDLDVVVAVHDAAEGALVVVDEAYAEFARPGTPSALTLLAGRPRLVVTRTMSKAFAMAGGRLGYLAADPALVDALRLVRMPYHLSTQTQAVALAALAHADVMLETVAAIKDAARPRRRGPARDGPRAGAERRELRAVRRARGRARHVVGAARAGRPRPRRGHSPLSSCHGRNSAGDQPVPRGPRRPRPDPPRRSRPVSSAAAPRTATVRRATSESTVEVTVDLDGTGRGEVSTGVPFYDHMLLSLAKHSLLDLTVRADGDTHVDAHHTVEDVAIVLGQAVREALGDKSGISRFGDATVPLDEALVLAVVDVAGRPYVVHEGEPPGQEYVVIGGSYVGSLTRHVLESFAFHAQIALHVRVLAGRDPHHVVEAQFKALARALRAAVARDPRVEGIPSAKGAL